MRRSKTAIEECIWYVDELLNWHWSPENEAEAKKHVKQARREFRALMALLRPVAQAEATAWDDPDTQAISEAVQRCRMLGLLPAGRRGRK